jgi:hypothetical protein
MQIEYQVHNLIILDESGSMSSIKSLIINGFNELVQSVKKKYWCKFHSVRLFVPKTVTVIFFGALGRSDNWNEIFFQI